MPPETKDYEVHKQDNVALVDIRETPSECINARGAQTSDTRYDLSAGSNVTPLPPMGDFFCRATGGGPESAARVAHRDEAGDFLVVRNPEAGLKLVFEKVVEGGQGRAHAERTCGEQDVLYRRVD